MWSTIPPLPPIAPYYASRAQQLQHESDLADARAMRAFVDNKPAYDFAAAKQAAVAAEQRWAQMPKNPQARTTQRAPTAAIDRVVSAQSCTPSTPLYEDMVERARASRNLWSP